MKTIDFSHVQTHPTTKTFLLGLLDSVIGGLLLLVVLVLASGVIYLLH